MEPGPERDLALRRSHDRTRLRLAQTEARLDAVRWLCARFAELDRMRAWVRQIGDDIDELERDTAAHARALLSDGAL